MRLRMTSQELSSEMYQLVETPEMGLRPLLGRLGSVAVVGSYDLGLIHPDNTEPDVDINFFNETDVDLVPLATHLGSELVGSHILPWHKFEVYDNRKAKRPAMPNSVYLGAKAYVPGGKIAADIWLFDDPELYAIANKNHTEIKAALTDHAARTIMDIKGECLHSGYGPSSMAIYRAVLYYGIRSHREYMQLAPNLRESLEEYSFQPS